jgi:hypothetical protein
MSASRGTICSVRAREVVQMAQHLEQRVRQRMHSGAGAQSENCRCKRKFWPPLG